MIVNQINCIRTVENCFYISLETLTKAINKNSNWVNRRIDPSEIKTLYIKEESAYPRQCIPLITCLRLLSETAMQGDINSFYFLNRLSEEATERSIAVSRNFFNIKNPRSLFRDWIATLKTPIKIGRDQARVMFNDYVQEVTGQDYEINRNFFAKLVKHAISEGFKISTVVQIKNRVSYRVYYFM